MIKNYTALDLETTGLNPKYEKIIEVGAVRVRDGKITEQFQSLIYPGKTLPSKITEITGITQQELENAPDASVVLPELLAFLGEDILLGHSIMFDYSFLKKASVNEGLWTSERQALGLDTLKLSRIYLPQLPSRRLSALCEYYHISHHAHRALGDAESTVRLYQILEEQFFDEKVFAPFPLIYTIKRESPITKTQKERLYQLLEQHKIIADYDVEKLSRNEASRIIDKIYLQYGRNARSKGKQSVSDS